MFRSVLLFSARPSPPPPPKSENAMANFNSSHIAIATDYKSQHSAGKHSFLRLQCVRYSIVRWVAYNM